MQEGSNIEQFSFLTYGRLSKNSAVLTKIFVILCYKWTPQVQLFPKRYETFFKLPTEVTIISKLISTVNLILS